MLDVSQLKVAELAKISQTSAALISRHFKNFPEPQVTRKNERIIGLPPQTVQNYLINSEFSFFYQGAVILAANLCGGVGKTSSIISLGSSIRRLTSDPIVFIDGDSQGSFTALSFGQPASDDEPILIDFLEGKVAIDDILTHVADNIWFIKSNLNNAYLDKVLSKPQDIKKAILKLYQGIFEKLGKKTKIFQDHTPQLSSLFASSLCAINQLDPSILRAVIIPIRSDNFAISGAEKILKEIDELTETFNLPNNIDIHCFFSSIDGRVKSTAEAMKVVNKKENLMQYLSPIVISYSVEIPKSINNSNTIYTSGKSNKAADDYQELLQYIFSYKTTKQGA